MSLEKRIHNTLSRLASQNSQYVRREGQIKMIGGIWQLFEQNDDDIHTAIIEAGTGTGKSIGYLIPTINALLENAKHPERPNKLIIATANVALQQQLVNKDIPTIMQAVGEDAKTLNVALLAGRGRYYCQRRAHINEQHHANLSLLEDDELSEQDISTLRILSEQFKRGTWSGLQDDLDKSIELSPRAWREVNAKVSQCDRQCPHYHNCPFIQSRSVAQEASVIVTNHALLCSDLERNVLLPKLSEAIVIVDEAHHLRDTYRDQASHSFSITRLRNLCEESSNIMGAIRYTSQSMGVEKICIDSVAESFGHIEELTDQLNLEFQSLRNAELMTKSQFEIDKGIVDLSARELSKSLILQCKGLCSYLMNIYRTVDLVIEEYRKEHEHLASQIEQLNEVHDTLLDLAEAMDMFAKQYSHDMAKWLHVYGDEKNMYTAHTCPVLVGNSIKRLLFDKAGATILTSATLSSLGNFGRFGREVGLSNEDAKALMVPAPFAYDKQGQITLYPSLPEPNFREEDKHITAMSKAVVKSFFLNRSHNCGLLLFASKRAMWRWYKLQSKQDKRCIILQDPKLSRQALLEKCSERTKKGYRSLLVGVQSLAEGLDYPDFTYIGIAKIPFADLSNVVDKCEAKLLEEYGMDPFAHIMLADASARLCQMVGRGIRTIHCQADINIFDPRLVHKQYGQTLLNHLPPMPVRYAESVQQSA